MPHLIQKVNGEIRNRQAVIQEFLDWLDAERDGCLAWDGERTYKPKSHKQVKTIFGLMIADTIAQCNDLGVDVSALLKYLVNDIPKGKGITKDLLHSLMYIICPTTDEEGRRVTLSKMNTKQAYELFESFRNIMAPLGVVIPDPDPQWREK